MSKETILQEAERIVNGPRREEYGGVTESFTRIAKLWSAILDVEVTPDQVSLCMVGLKIARFCASYHRDSIVDIAGYARTLEIMEDERNAKS